MKKRCQNCLKEVNAKFFHCPYCGFDEALEVYPESRSTQSIKGKVSPYKRGGSRRAAK